MSLPTAIGWILIALHMALVVFVSGWVWPGLFAATALGVGWLVIDNERR